jgi:hypothetical protein
VDTVRIPEFSYTFSALSADEDCDRVSFTRTLRVARRSTASHPGFSPQVLDAAQRQATSELLFELLNR